MSEISNSKGENLVEPGQIMNQILSFTNLDASYPKSDTGNVFRDPKNPQVPNFSHVRSL